MGEERPFKNICHFRARIDFSGIIAGFASKKRRYLPNLKRCKWFAVRMTGPRLISGAWL